MVWSVFCILQAISQLYRMYGMIVRSSHIKSMVSKANKDVSVSAPLLFYQNVEAEFLMFISNFIQINKIVYVYWLQGIRKTILVQPSSILYLLPPWIGGSPCIEDHILNLCFIFRLRFFLLMYWDNKIGMYKKQYLWIVLCMVSSEQECTALTYLDHDWIWGWNSFVLIKVQQNFNLDKRITKMRSRSDWPCKSEMYT